MGTSEGKQKRFNFTMGAIKALPAPEKLTFYYDERTRGLAVSVMPSGTKVFYLYKRVEGRPKQIKIGVFPATTVELARAKADEMNAAIAAGQDPAKPVGRSKGEWTFAELGEDWVAYARDKKQKKSWALDAWMLTSYFGAMGHRRLSKLTRTDFRQLHADLTASNGTYAANRAMELARAMFNRAIACEVFPGPNPVLGVEWNKKKDRDRRVLPGEMKAFFDALDAEPSADMRDYVLLSLFTGQRQANVLSMRWDQVDFVGRTWHIPDSKNGDPIWVPLEDVELDLLRRRRDAIGGASPWVFPTRSRTGHMVEPKNGWRRILKHAGLKDLRLHDLRRTLGSFMADEDVQLSVIGKTLGHRSPASTLIYARFSLRSVRAGKRKAHEAIFAVRDLDDGDSAAQA